ncbi:MAG: LysR family transcriptional regulator [Hyphomonadaceae bacterium]
MRDVNLSGVDLNLLPQLEALLRRRNVTRAAHDVGLSQPAMSRALARLRELLNDPLLVRAHGELVLTPHAEALRRRLAPALDQVKSVFVPPAFDPATVERTVRIVCADTHTILLAPRLMARLAAEAPGIDLRLVSYGPDTIARMETGELDLAFAVATTPLPPGTMSEVIGHDRLALVMRRRHPMAKRRWSIEDYAAVDHVGVSLLGDAQSDLDAILARSGVSRRMAITTPHFIAALAIASETNLVTTIARSFAERFAEEYDLVLKEPPFSEVALDGTLVWSGVRNGDPVLAWLRSIIAEIMKELQPRSARPRKA